MRPISEARRKVAARLGCDIVSREKEEEKRRNQFFFVVLLLLYLSHGPIREEGGWYRWEAMFISILKSELPRLVGRIYITIPRHCLLLHF